MSVEDSSVGRSRRPSFELRKDFRLRIQHPEATYWVQDASESPAWFKTLGEVLTEISRLKTLNPNCRLYIIHANGNVESFEDELAGTPEQVAAMVEQFKPKTTEVIEKRNPSSQESGVYQTPIN